MLDYDELLKYLLEQGDITPEQCHAAREQAAPADWLAAKGYVSTRRLLEVRAELLGRPFVILSREPVDAAALHSLPLELIRRHSVLPYAFEQGSLLVAMADPLDRAVLDDVLIAVDADVIPVLADAAELALAVRQYLAFGGDAPAEQFLTALNREPSASRTMSGESDGAVIRVVDAILHQAVRGHCSDIHLEPQGDRLRLRLRVDGELYELPSLPAHIQNAVISRIKILAELDIAEKRLAQDGHFLLTIDGQETDFRVSTLPTIHGEKMVLRILDRSASLLSISRLR
ncbi:MAG: ATPase, T2SS/T4P/T4SS family, partial [Syntrophomonadaceae bacterium]|nr:ATPase, T2SS/T4P/T4SS family [Syntrophomonadaceae bacterium]